MINWKNKKVNDESVRDETVIEEPVKEEINNSEKEIDFFNVLDDDSLATLFKENWSDNRIDVLVKLFTNSSRNMSDFLILLSVFLYRSLQVNAISADELSLLGIDMHEVTSLINAVSGSGSDEELLLELNIRATVKEIKKISLAIMIENNLDTTKVEVFQALLASTSIENSIFDLKAAYKYLVATREDTILEFKR